MGNKNSTLQQKQIAISPNVEKIPSYGTEAYSVPEGWRVVKLGEVFKFTKKPKELRYSEFEQIPFVPMDLLPLGYTSFDGYILKSRDEISSGTYFEPGDILVAKITPSFENGKQGIIEKLPAPFGIATTEVIPIKEVQGIGDKYYLFYYLLRQDIRAELAGKMEGSTGRQRLSLTTLADLELPFPPLPQQRAIAKVLRTVQEAIQTRRDELKLERERKAALMEYLFTNGTHGEPVKQTEIGDIPESWKIGHLRDVIQSAPQNGAFVKQPHLGTGTLYVNVYDIYQSPTINLKTVERMECEPSFVARYALKENDILFVRSSLKREGIGQCCLVREMEEPAIFDCHLIKVSPNTATVLPLYLTYFFLSELGRKELIARSKTTTMTTINQNTLIDSLVPIPSLAEQRDITQVLEACDNKVAALEQELSLLEELLNALLEELMTGRLSTLPLIEKGETHE